MERFGARLGLLLLGATLCLGCRSDVLHGIPEGEANHVLAVLQQHGITATKALDNEEKITFTIAVPSSATNRAWGILTEYKLPKDPDRRFQDVFGKNSLVSTPKEQEARYLEALQGELGHTLQRCEGVIDARVHLVLPEKDLLGRSAGEAKASVFVEYQSSSQGLKPMEDVEIQQLIASGIKGLDPANVTVIQKPAPISVPTTSNQAGGVNLVQVGPLVLEESTVSNLKILALVLILIVTGLAAALFWQGRRISTLQSALQRSIQEARSRDSMLVPTAPRRNRPAEGG